LKQSAATHISIMQYVSMFVSILPGYQVGKKEKTGYTIEICVEQGRSKAVARVVVA
jgi:hypothetical protein